MKVGIAPLAALGVAVFATACGEDEVDSADPSSLEGVPWVLSAGLDVEAGDEASRSATVAGGRVAGSTACTLFTARTGWTATRSRSAGSHRREWRARRRPTRPSASTSLPSGG